ncbi:Lysine-specific demethylase 4B [Phytophthora pseudosyringae]|uniref:Lysine-specific demethylase 4B n=1 Tax=Phytophthora pseudosyringae TaxID=221518 RepID=A0A8T1WLD1_9STRA|nr:Lysine-specific demethylase 4B [Phytophthora pseudosyringae]
MARRGKDASVGEYDAVTALTHVTRQRGRLLFNMGASVKKRQWREPPPVAAAKAAPPPTSTGAFTGLSLYLEEANYLLQRGALAIHLLSSKGGETKELSVAEFTATLLKEPRVSLACMDVYTFLKDQKLHPRRCLEPLTVPSCNDDGRSVPRHYREGEPWDVAFDVWKTVTVDVEPPAAVPAALTAAAKPKKQRKKLVLVFRVAVCRYGDAAPDPRSLRLVIASSKARDLDGSGDGSSAAGCSSAVACGQIPLKLAVIHHDQSVLLFEISSGNPSEPHNYGP